MAYVEKHQLYDIALSIWMNTERYEVRVSSNISFKSVLTYGSQTVLSVYGDWLFERREFKDAAFGTSRGYFTLLLSDLVFSFQEGAEVWQGDVGVRESLGLARVI